MTKAVTTINVGDDDNPFISVADSNNPFISVVDNVEVIEKKHDNLVIEHIFNESNKNHLSFYINNDINLY